MPSPSRPPKPRGYHFTFDGRTVTVPLTDTVHTHWMEQFHTKTGKNAEARNKTLRNMIRAAYALGRKDGRGDTNKP